MIKTTFTKEFNSTIASTVGSLSHRIQETLDLVLGFYPEGGWIDSYSVASAVGAHVTYIQHLLREVPHVCRYADQSQYRAHSQAKCSPKCQDHFLRDRKPVEEIATYCSTCFLQLPICGVCGNC